MRPDRRGDAVSARPPAAGFTLIEVLAVVLLTSVVIGVALDHYVDLTRASQRAGEHTTDVRRATALLDRVARDLEGATLVTRDPEIDPLAHPWIFMGEARYSGAGADRLKFVTRGHRPRSSDAHESDLELVAYSLRPLGDGEYELLRWSSPRLPESLDKRIPSDEDEGARLLAEGLADFGVRFIDEFGERHDTWDSSDLVQSNLLPTAAQVEVAWFDPEAPLELEPERYRRTVVLPIRPLDLAELTDPLSVVNGGTEEEEEGDVSEETAECRQTPCGSMTACQAIGCAQKVGRFEHSLDQLIRDTMQTDPPFCQWRYGVGPQLRARLIDDPACR
jgi:hypothetical protein